MLLVDISVLRRAAVDFRYLLDRGYPREASLTLVGNRYHLRRTARQLLHRGVFDRVTAANRRNKLRKLQELTDRPLAVDGHNVLITLEAGLRGLPLVAADDGCIRDVAEISRAYRPGPVTAQALSLMVAALQQAVTGPVAVLFDAPMRKSGELAQATREALRAAGLPGETRAVPVPETELLAFSGAIATSDTHLIDARKEIVDLAGEIIRSRPSLSAALVTLPGE
jgi:hypothetical protein